MINGSSRSGSVTIGVLNALHLLRAESKPTSLDAICEWFATTNSFYYDDWLTVGGRSAKQYVADILEDLRDLGVVRIAGCNAGSNSQSDLEWIPSSLPDA